MKILQLGKFYPILGGVEKVMYDLMCGLSERKIDCDMLCAAVEGNDFTKEVNAHARIVGCRTLRKIAGTMISPKMISVLRKRCSEYDLIHVHHPDPMAALALLLSDYKGKVVLHWHSDIVKQRILLNFYLPLQQWLINRADSIVGTSPVYLESSPYLKKVQYKTVCIPIGIERMASDAKRTQEIRERFGDRKIIFSLGRMVEYKGFQNLIEAARYLNDDYVVVIGGQGELRKKLEDLILALNLQNRVLMPGRIDDEYLPAYYEASTLFCLPSIMKTEAFAIVQIEAMSFGKPVVATTIVGSGVPWVNSHGKSGLNVPPKDPRRLADAIMKICQKKEDYAMFSEGALANYSERFTQKLMIEKCINNYTKLL